MKDLLVYVSNNLWDESFLIDLNKIRTIDHTYWLYITKAVLNKNKYAVVDHLKKVKEIEEDKAVKKKEKDIKKAREQILTLDQLADESAFQKK